MHGLGFDFHWQDRSWYVLFVDRPEHIGHHSAKESLYEEYRRELAVASVVIIREPVAYPLPEEYIAAADLAELLSRNFNLPLHVIGSRKYRHVLSPNLNPGVPSPLQPEMAAELFRQLRAKELVFFVDDAGALLRATGGLVFRGPSRKYCPSFLRVGSVQTNRTALDSFFFWLLPWLEQCEGIVTESWTISSIALNASRLLARYDPKARRHCRVDMLSEYYDGSSRLVSTANAVLRRVATPTDGSLLVLVSACMSGNLVGRLRGTMAKEFLDLQRFRFGTLYSLSKTHDIAALCDLSDGHAGAKFEWFTDLPQQWRGKTVVDIDRKAYFPLEVYEEPILISAGLNPEATTACEVLNRYRNKGLFSVHRDCHDLNGHRERHHAIFTDLLAIANLSAFRRRFVAKLEALPRTPALIVAPPHRAGKRLAENAAAWFAQKGTKVPVFLHSDMDVTGGDLDADETALRNALLATGEDDAVLILDDVSVTGRRLTRYSESLRAMNYAGGINIIVGLARPPSKAEWERRTQQLRFRQRKDKPAHTVEHVEFLILPDWETEDCPWCCEMRLYSQLVEQHGALPKLLARRQQRLVLTQESKGLVNDLFLTAARGHRMTFNSNSILLKSPASQADVFVAVAGAIQRLRTGDDTYMDRKRKREFQPRLQPHYPQIAFLSIDNYLGDRFSETAIRSSILRAALEPDLESPTTPTENQRIERARRAILEPRKSQKHMALELMLSMALGKLPPLPFANHELALLQHRPDFAALELLLNTSR
jgi:hypothetical protein